MLIFDSFPTHKHADEFAICVRDTYGRATRVFKSQEDSDKYDVFPFELCAIVLVERDGDTGQKLESQIEQLVVEFNGRFAGT